MTKVDHVDAVFGGERIRFRLAPENLNGFEYAISGSAYQCFTKFAGGFWTFADVEAVLTWAMPLNPVSNDAVIAGLFQHPGLDGFRVTRQPHPEVQRGLRQRPPAVYSVLATRILEAALFGIDEALAIFDENAAETAQ